jgi:hypothetical protein
MNQKLKSKFRQGNVQLRLPPSLAEALEQAEVSPTVIFHRLLSAFVPLSGKPFGPKVQPRPCGAVSFSKVNPAEFPGTSAFV